MLRKEIKTNYCKMKNHNIFIFTDVPKSGESQNTHCEQCEACSPK